MSKKIFISQPMTNLDESEILATRKKETQYIKEHIEGAEIVGKYFKDATREYVESFEQFDYIKNWDIYWLGRSIEGLAQADVLWLCNGWEYSKGCNIELECAISYGLEISYPPERRSDGEQ